MAIDREQICEIAMYGYTHPADATGLSDAFEPGRTRRPRPPTGSPTMSTRPTQCSTPPDSPWMAMSASGRRHAMEFDLNVVSGWSDWVQSCEIMAQNLDGIGIKATCSRTTSDLADARAGWRLQMSIGWSDAGRNRLQLLPRRDVDGDQEAGRRVRHRELAPLRQRRKPTPCSRQFAATSDEAEQRDIANQLQELYADNAPAVPLFPGPQWGEFNTTRFTASRTRRIRTRSSRPTPTSAASC